MASTIKTKIKKGEGIRKEKRLPRQEDEPNKERRLEAESRSDKVGQRPPESDEKYGRPSPSR